MTPERPVSAPPRTTSLTIVHKLAEIYKQVYQIGKKLNKGDKLGIWSEIEQRLLKALENSISASFSSPAAKAPMIQQLSLEVEVSKRLIRLTYEIRIIEDNVYLKLANELEEISKMATGWKKYINQKESQ